MNNNSNSCLMVIIPDRLSDLVKKGEITERYYNPGDLFKEVHIIMTNNDEVEVSAVQKTVGSAKLFIHNLPADKSFFITTLGWQPWLMEAWIRKGLKLAESISSDLIRVHNNFLEGYLAKRIKDAFGTKYVISLHGVWDRDCLIGLPRKIIRLFRIKLERISLENADAVLAVYGSIIRYAKEYGAQDVQLIYNIVAGENIKKKASYGLSKPPRLITINRQLKEKNPENIIKAISDIDCRYTIIGNGAYHEYLKEVANNHGCSEKVEFIKAMPNEKICEFLSQCDIMVSHCDYWGMSKTVIEGGLAGLPIIINRHPAEPIPEYEGDWLTLCDNTVEGYKKEIMKLIGSEDLRANFGEKAYIHAKETFDSAVMENKVVGIYKKLIGMG